MTDTDVAIDGLYTLPLDEFTAARNELAKALNAAGDKEAAATVKGLQKPSVPAWTINQLARQRTAEMTQLLEVQTRLGEAGSAKEVRELSNERRDLVARLVKAAEQILEAGGHNAGSETLQKISRTLLAGTTGDEAETVRSGRLSRDLSASGFGAAFGFQPDQDDDEEVDAVDERARRKAQELTAEADAAEQQAVELERTAEQLRAQADEAQTKAEAAHRRADKTRAKADAAWEKLG